MTHTLRKRFPEKELDELCAELDPARIPRHVAIMMDGNRRWAKSRNLPPIAGHWKGAEAISALVSDAAEIGVRVLTVYSFSTENWNRNPEEVEGLMHLLKIYLQKEMPRMVREGVRLDTIGDPSRFPADVKQILEEAKEETKNCT
ncbi:MAG: polyprenyl diphosphate synthase [Chlamydiales bacterium]